MDANTTEIVNQLRYIAGGLQLIAGAIFINAVVSYIKIFKKK